MVAGPPVLETRGLCKAFGGVVAVANVNLAVQEGQIHAVIGSNGAGKTTLLNLISGLTPPDGGEIRFRGEPLAGRRPSDRAALGVGRTFQNLQILGNMTVLENVMVGRHLKSGSGLMAAALRLRRAQQEERAIEREALRYLEFMGLADRRDDPAGSLPFGQQRWLEIARALATEPSLLLLDEPAAGLNPTETDCLGGLIQIIRNRGITVVLVEHDMDLVMRVSDTVLVLNYGEVLAEGPPAEIQNNPAVVDAYLGSELDDA
ncbi:MAG TPA: ABC transporter ATP-binding protein [Candidatus Methylomirabilis sp.]|nr:ABC transporter ATP-binding protein [Candidatus Methylomirabilis sp.]